MAIQAMEAEAEVTEVGAGAEAEATEVEAGAEAEAMEVEATTLVAEAVATKAVVTEADTNPSLLLIISVSLVPAAT